MPSVRLRRWNGPADALIIRRVAAGFDKQLCQICPYWEQVGALRFRRLGPQLNEQHRRVELQIAPAQLPQFIAPQTSRQDDQVR
jgi:hypothetical protein